MNDPLSPTIQNEFLRELKITLPNPIDLDEAASLDKVRKDDIELWNMNRRILIALWEKVETLSAAVLLVRETNGMIKLRRDIMGYQYGAPTDKSPKGNTWEAIP